MTETVPYPGLAMSDADLASHIERSKSDWWGITGSEFRQVACELRHYRTTPTQPAASEEVVQRVARAIYEVIWPATEWDDGEWACWTAARAAARAALSAAPLAGDGWAMVPRVPTQGMREAATEVPVDDGEGNRTALNWEEADAVWANMLAASLASGGE